MSPTVYHVDGATGGVAAFNVVMELIHALVASGARTGEQAREIVTDAAVNARKANTTDTNRAANFLAGVAEDFKVG